jgi:hypothetical protein
MEEIFPVACGIILGLAVAYLFAPRRRGWGLATGSVLFGGLASWITGELSVSWGYLAIDVGQVFVAGALTWILALRWRRLAGVARREA